jgi:hypothetical protein
MLLGQEADPAVPELEEMTGGDPTTLGVVGADRAEDVRGSASTTTVGTDRTIRRSATWDSIANPMTMIPSRRSTIGRLASSGEDAVAADS